MSLYYGRKRRTTPPPVELPAEVEVTPDRWEVRLHGIRLGHVWASDGLWIAGSVRGYAGPSRFRTRDEAVAALIAEARS